MRLSLLDKEGVWTWARRTCSAAPAQPGLPEPLALGFCATRAATARQLQVDANPATHGPGRPRGAHPYLHFYKSHCQTVKCILPSQTALDLLRIGHHLRVTVHSWNSSLSGKQLSRESFLPDTASFTGDLLVNSTEQHCLLNLNDDPMIFTPNLYIHLP